MTYGCTTAPASSTRTPDTTTALDWLTAGLLLALATGDPEELVGQLSELRTASLVALGRHVLQRTAEDFLANRQHDNAEAPRSAPP